MITKKCLILSILAITSTHYILPMELEKHAVELPESPTSTRAISPQREPLGSSNEIVNAKPQEFFGIIDQPNNDHCHICIDQFQENDQIAKLPCYCARAYHANCLKHVTKCDRCGYLKKSDNIHSFRFGYVKQLIQNRFRSSETNLPIAIMNNIKYEQAFSGISSHTCSACDARFEDYDIISKYSCNCTFAYHSKCMKLEKCRFCGNGIKNNLLNPFYFEIKDKMTAEPQNPVPSAAPALPIPNENNRAEVQIRFYNIEPSDFANLNSDRLQQCAYCHSVFGENSHITKFPCQCAAVYHDYCLMNYRRSGRANADKCPSCNVRMSENCNAPSLPYTDVQPKQSHNINKTKQSLNQSNSKINTLYHFVSAMVLGWGTEYILTSDMSKTKKGIGLSLLGSAFVCENLIYERNKKFTDNLSKKGLTWFAGSTFGFVLPKIIKKIQNKQIEVSHKN